MAKFDPCSRTKSRFSKWPKVDNITNNNCKAFNAKILKFKGKSIITMLEEIRCFIMKIMARQKKALAGYMGLMAPN